MLGIVERDSGDTRWLHNGDRVDGHQLTSLTIDGSTWPISHDDAGRVTEGANTDYEYGPRGKLLRTTRGALHQQYFYDADGRLVRFINGATRTFAYDGDQMIGAYTGNTPRWEVAPVAFTDQILEHPKGTSSRACALRAYDGPSGQLVAITDHRNSIVGW